MLCKWENAGVFTWESDVFSFGTVCFVWQRQWENVEGWNGRGWLIQWWIAWKCLEEAMEGRVEGVINLMGLFKRWALYLVGVWLLWRIWYRHRLVSEAASLTLEWADSFSLWCLLTSTMRYSVFVCSW
jgi:hypothetical protein